MTTGWLGAERVELDTCASTNDEAATLANHGAVHGTVVTARQQTAGRGRGDHDWYSPDGNVYLSAVLRPRLELRHVPPVTLAAGIGVFDAVNSYGVAPSLKWPNDVLVRRRKIAGILTEMSSRGGAVDHVIVGVGCNLNTMAFPPELDGLATSLALARGGRPVDRARFIDVLLGRLEGWLDRFFAGGIDAIGAHWSERANFAGKRIRAREPSGTTLEGVVVGLADDGALLVRDASGEQRRIVAGDVSVLGSGE